MFKKVRTLPAPIRMQITVRFSFSVVFLGVFLCILIFTRDFILSFPCLVIGAFLLVNSAVVYYRGTRNKFIAVNGICTDVEYTRIRKKIKYIYIQVGEMSVRFPVRKRVRKLSIGDGITLYLPESTRVYEKDGCLVIFDYYAWELTNDVKNGGVRTN